MKTNFCMPVALALLIMVSCNDSNNRAETDKSADSAAVNPAPVDSPQAGTTTQGNIDATPFDEKSGKTATEMAGGGMMEVTLGQTAQDKAENPRVREFGAMMVRDHGKANEELKAIAAAKNFTLPAALPEKHQKHVDDLGKKQGKDFDKAYMKMMVNDHEEDIKKFEKAATDATDPALRDFASRTLPVLRVHLDSAKAINKQQ